MFKSKQPAPLAAALLLALGAPASAYAADGGWDWQVIPYLWATSIDTELKTDTHGTFNDSISFADIANNLKGGFLGHVEGQGDNVGFFGDFIFLNVGKTKSGAVSQSSIYLKSRIIEMAMVYSPAEVRSQGWEMFGGMRFFDTKINVSIDPVPAPLPTRAASLSTTFPDIMIGSRYTFRPSEQWSIALRGDYSAGGTEGTWSASVEAQYHLKKGAWLIGYRHMDISLAPRGQQLEMIMSGPEVAYAINF